MRVAYLTSAYPAISHAFIEREVLGLRDLGHEVHTFSVRPTSRDDLLTPTMHAEFTRTTALLGDRRALLRRTTRFAGRHPLALMRGVRRALGTGPGWPKQRLWQLFYLVEAVGLLALLRERGLRHVHAHFSNVAADVARQTVALGRDVDGARGGWLWTMSLHGPTEFEDVRGFDLAAKLSGATAVACISDFARSQAMRLTEPEHWDHLKVVHMSIDTEHYALHPPRRPEPPWRLLFVGRLVPEKGPNVLLEAVALLRERWSLEITFVGAGPLDDALALRAQQLGLDDVVTFAGAQGQDELPKFYARADVFCLPSFQEGLPVVLMEAMASGLPVVSTRIAGIPELVTSNAGRLVSAGRADQLADAIEELLASPSLLRPLGEAGRARVCEDFSSVSTAPRMAQFLSDAKETVSRSR